MKRNNLPLLLMLVTGLITCIITYFKHYTMTGMLAALFIVFLFSAIFGSIIKEMLNYFDKQNEIKSMEEGEVIEKEAESVEGVESVEAVKSE